jgi:dCTP deaminase
MVDDDVRQAATGGAGNDENAGILPSQVLRKLIASGSITATSPITDDQIQPASIDLRLGSVAYRVRAGFLPGPDSTVLDKLEAFAMHEFPLDDSAVLEKGCVYIVPLEERMCLPSEVSGMANPKSSTGRLDIFTRLIADHADEFDHVAPGYEGPIYCEISPRTFSILVRPGTRLNQLRLQHGVPSADDGALRRLHQQVPLVASETGEAGDIDQGIAVSVDLGGDGERPIGYRARRHTALIDLARVDHYPLEEFWEPLYADTHRALILNPGDFYILASKESVTVPPDHAAEMRPFDTRVGEFRVHYAGFFDPGFGYDGSGGAGSRAVLEVRSFEVPFVLQDGQRIGRLTYARLTETPDKVYGIDIGSSYQRQGLALAKQFAKK